MTIKPNNKVMTIQKDWLIRKQPLSTESISYLSFYSFFSSFFEETYLRLVIFHIFLLLATLCCNFFSYIAAFSLLHLLTILQFFLILSPHKHFSTNSPLFYHDSALKSYSKAQSFSRLILGLINFRRSLSLECNLLHSLWPYFLRYATLSSSHPL